MATHTPTSAQQRPAGPPRYAIRMRRRKPALYRNGRLFGIDAAVLASGPSLIVVAHRPAASPHETLVTHHIPRALVADAAAA